MGERDPRHERLLARYLEKELDRRRLIGMSLKAGLAGVLAAQLPGALAGCVTADDDDTAGDDDDVGPEEAPVGVAGGSDPVQAAAAALELAGGLSFLQAGQSVFIKLASNQAEAYPFSTNPDVLVWLAEQLRAAGAGDITCGDSPFFGDHGDVFGPNGLQAAADAAKIPLHDFRETKEWVTIPTEEAPDWAPALRLPAVMMEADHIVNLPCLKTHFIAGVTLALKLQIGATHPDDRGYALGSHDNVDRQIAQLNAPFTPSLTITEGVQACINGGPSSAYPGTEVAELGLALASRDRVAHDAVGTAILRQFTSEDGLLLLPTPWDLGAILESRALGLGIATPEDVQLRFEGVEAALAQAIEADVTSAAT